MSRRHTARKGKPATGDNIFKDTPTPHNQERTEKKNYQQNEEAVNVAPRRPADTEHYHREEKDY